MLNSFENLVAVIGVEMRKSKAKLCQVPTELSTLTKKQEEKKKMNYLY